MKRRWRDWSPRRGMCSRQPWPLASSCSLQRSCFFFFHSVPLTFLLTIVSSCVSHLLYDITCFLPSSARIALPEYNIVYKLMLRIAIVIFLYLPFIVASCVLDKAPACPFLPSEVRSGSIRRNRWLRESVKDTKDWGNWRTSCWRALVLVHW